jgi:transposase
MWTPATRRQHSRIVTRYQTDLTDAEWRVIALHLPKPSVTGRRREWPMREIVNGIFYVTRAGCPWRLLPNDLPPWGTIYRWFAAWRDDGRFERINHALVMADRERVGRDASPSIREVSKEIERQPNVSLRHKTDVPAALFLMMSGKADLARANLHSIGSIIVQALAYFGP